MVDVQRTNLKLINRAREIFRAVFDSFSTTHISLDLRNDDEIDHLIDSCEGSVKQASVAAKWGCSPREAKLKLERAEGILKIALMQCI
jgi:N-acetylmuramic acid 6-phosphate etherase